MTSSADITLNQAAAHDTGIYDPSVHDNQIVAMYETDVQAQAARQSLIAGGIPAEAIQVIARGTDTGTLGGVNPEDANGGVWGALRSLFVPDEDRVGYTHAVGRGHAMLVVTPGAGMDRVGLVRALEASGPVDFDARLEEWRQQGYDATTPHQEYAAVATAATAVVPTPSIAAAGAEDTIQVVEESLRVGKREVAAGAVRIRSYVVERPVQQQVSLHEEFVTVERHAVNRPVTGADFDAFQERTIEARATSEEAVVTKDIRVVEEIGLKKHAAERVETIHDSVRKTEVEIDGDATAVPGLPATAGASTSGANAPRK